ncbi:MAG: O-methyltransferase [Parcubacteria group bacterium Gr01-1014_38]|nr:MAG: O-methyltransferase [Parcubacteria group bacterium Gr01-1014_38]
MTVSPRVREVLSRLEETRWKYYNLHPASGEVLALLARVSRPQRVIEVGTSNGYSAILLGEAARESGGQVVTIERNSHVAAEAQRNIAEAGLQDVVTVLSGSAYKVLRDLPGPWDFAFLDATKQEYVGYLDRILPKFASPALLVADNLLSHEEELAEFRERVAAEPRLDATILPIGTGLLVGVYDQPPSEPAHAERAAVALNEVLAAVQAPAR